MLSRIAFIALALFCLTPYCSSALALILGVALALSLGNAWSDLTKAYTPKLLSLSVIGLGAGMNLVTVAHVGASGIGYTLISIAMAFAVGLSLARVLGVERTTSLLVTVGTAICGGSAIAATAPVLRAKPHQISVALGIVFMLNAVALLIFPWLGHLTTLSEAQFGLWSALAIHDTSSVVGATLQYGPCALEVGTTVKLARALWIVPVVLTLSTIESRASREDRVDSQLPKAKTKKPWFILGFLVMAALVTFIPELKEPGHMVEAIAKRLLVLTLFFIGTNLTRETLKAVGFRPFLQGLGLWVIIALSTLIVIAQGWIHA